MTTRTRTTTPAVCIGARAIGPAEPAWIVAEAGVNHDGSVERALALIDHAAAAGADAVKFQCFDAELLAGRDAPLCGYQAERAPGAADQRRMLEALELPVEAWPHLARHAAERKIEFFASPFGVESLALLLDLGVRAIKLGSGELTDVALLRNAARSRLPLLLSTGMANWEEIERAVDVVRCAGAPDPILLHCVTSYPTPLGDANVRAVCTIAARTGCLTGYSDHCEEDEPSLAARALGACVLERHLTWDRAAAGPDHAASLDPVRFRSWVGSVRRLEASLGDGAKRHTLLEEEARRSVRKSLVARAPIAAGTEITERLLAARRPAGAGLGAEEWDRVIGRVARVEIGTGEPLAESHFEPATEKKRKRTKRHASRHL